MTLGAAPPIRRATPGAPTAHHWDVVHPLATTDVRVSVVVPVYNEEATLELLVRRLRAVPAMRLEIVAVNDASTDQTAPMLDALARRGLVDVVVHLPANQGKGAAVRAGFAAATGDIIVIQDADLEYDPFDLPRLVAPIIDGRADAVIGTRFGGEAHRVFYFWHSVVNKALTLLSNVLSGLNLTDMEVCSKAVRRDVLTALPLRATRFGIEPELVARLAQSKVRVYEVAVSYAGRTYEEGKKITWRDGVAALWHILVYNLGRPHAPRLRPEPFATWVARERTRPAGTAVGPGVAAGARPLAPALPAPAR